MLGSGVGRGLGGAGAGSTVAAGRAASLSARTTCTQTPAALTSEQMKTQLEDEPYWYAQPDRSAVSRNKAPLWFSCPFGNRMEQVNRILTSKIINKVKIAKGSGEMTGSHYHCVEIDSVNLHVAKTLFWGLPRPVPLVVVAAGGGPAGGDVTPGMGVTSLLLMLHGFDGVPFGKILFRILSMWFVERQQTVRRSTT